MTLDRSRIDVLDRIYYDNVKVVTSAVKSDHKAVVAYTGPPLRSLNKRRDRLVFRKRSPTQHALFLQYASQLQIELPGDADVQSNYDSMYRIMSDLLDRFYPERETTVTSSDPHFVTPAVKAMLRRKNRLMHAGRIEEAGALARRIRSVITRRNTAWLRKANTRKCAKDAWSKVREITGGGRRHDESHDVDGITAQVLNDHYAAVSTDHNYQATSRKVTVPNH